MGYCLRSLAALLLLSITACTDNEQETSVQPKPAPETVNNATQETENITIGDVTINRSTFGPNQPLETKVQFCARCHGEKGGGDADFGPNTDFGTPALTGLSSSYIAEQLNSYRDGSRNNEEMASISRLLTNVGITQLSDYYAALPAPAIKSQAAIDKMISGPDNEQLSEGHRIATAGLPEKRVMACQSCHGTNGAGMGEGFPRLAGQNSAYLVQRLKSFRSGKVKTKGAVQMSKMTRNLDDKEISALASYYSSLNAN